MKVKELIEELKKYDQEKIVWLSSDAEGNTFHGVAGISINNKNVVIWSDDEYYNLDDEIINGGEYSE